MPPMTWQTLDWAALDRLREQFLAGERSPDSYWRSHGDLANYDFTYAQRIGWKWDAVLRELRLRGWRPPAGPLLDWSCGSGVASRRVIQCFGASHFTALRVFDRSPVAMQYAMEQATKRFPALAAESLPANSDALEPSTNSSAAGAGTLVISHVLNELDEAGGAALRRHPRSAQRQRCRHRDSVARDPQHLSIPSLSLPEG